MRRLGNKSRRQVARWPDVERDAGQRGGSVAYADVVRCEATRHSFAVGVPTPLPGRG